MGLVILELVALIAMVILVATLVIPFVAPPTAPPTPSVPIEALRDCPRLVPGCR